MAQIVELPGGETIEFPDGMSQDAMRQAIWKGMPQYAPDMRDANDIDTGVSKQAVRQAYADAQPKPAPAERTWGEALYDTHTQLAKGLVNIAAAPVNLLAPDSDAAKYFKGESDKLEAMQSEALRGKLAQREQEIQQAAQNGEWESFKTSLSTALSDPAIASKIVAETLPSMLPVLGAAKAAEAIAIVKNFSPQAATWLARGAAAATNAGLTAGDARQASYEDLKATYEAAGLPDANQRALDESRKAAAVGAGFGAVGGAFGAEANILGKTIGKTAAGRAAGAFGTEAVTELGEEIAPVVTTNVIAGEVDNRDWSKNVGRTAADTLIGVGPMATAGAVGAALTPADILKTPDVDTAIQTAQAALASTDLDVTGTGLINEIEREQSALQDFNNQTFVEPNAAAAVADADQPVTGAVQPVPLAYRNQQIINVTPETPPGITPPPYQRGTGGAISDSSLPIIGQEQTTAPAPAIEGAPKTSLYDQYLAIQQKVANGATPTAFEAALLKNPPPAPATPQIELPAQKQQAGEGQARLIQEVQRARQMAKSAPTLEQDAAQDDLAPSPVTMQTTPVQAPRPNAPTPTTQTQLEQQESIPRTNIKVGGTNADLLSNEQLQAIAADPKANKNTRRAAQEVLSTRFTTQRSDIAELERQTFPDVGDTNGNQATQAQQVATPVQGVQQAPSQGGMPAAQVQPVQRRSPAIEAILDDGSQAGEVDINSLGSEVSSLSGRQRMGKIKARGIKVLMGLFGRKVVFFETNNSKAEGVYTGTGRTIYVNVDSGTDALAVVNHEFGHTLETEHAEDYEKAVQAAEALIRADAGRAAKYGKYARDSWLDANGKLKDEHVGDLARELISDITGNESRTGEFWKDVFDEVTRQNPEQARGIIGRIRDAVVKFINKLIAATPKKGFDLEGQGFTRDDLKQIRDQVVKMAAKSMVKAERIRMGLEQDSMVGDGVTRFASNRPDFKNQTLPTRWPTSKKLDPAPSVDDPMITDFDTLKQDQAQYAKAVKAIIEEPGMHSPDIVNGTLDDQAEHVIERMRSNLLWLYDQVPQAIRERSKLWYDGARKIAEAWATNYDITESQAAGALAVLSPQKDWFMNVTMAERVLDIVHTKLDHTFDDRMDAAAFGFLTKDSVKEDPDAQKNLKAYEAVRGKTLREVAKHHDLRQMSVWIRAYDEAYHDAKHAIVTPEGGFVEDKTTKKGEPTLRAWGDFNTPGKAASIYFDGRPENINKMLGGEHKVRNFYNNIYAPQDPRFTTIDTHAVAADMLRPLAGADKPVADNFGKTGGTNITGLSGTYALHYEAYRRAAEDRGVLPREMQSITWEAVRGLFTEGYKGKKENVRAIDAIWERVDAGELSIDQARQEVLDHAGGIENPDWWQEGNAEYKEVLRDKTYVQKRGNFAGARVNFEVAPDPRNTEQKARWDALPGKVKEDISHKVAWKIAAKALASFGDENMKGELHQQTGGWLDDTNPSLSIWFNKRAAASKISEFTRMLGFALNQMGMMRTSPKPFKGADGKTVQASGVIYIDLPANTDVNLLYGKIRGIVDAKGKPYVFGHSTSVEQMAIIHTDEKRISTKELAKKIADVIGDEYEVGDHHIYADFPEKGRNSYGLRGQKATPSESSLRTRSDQLRAESGVLLEQLIGEYEQRTGTVRRSNARSDVDDRAGAASQGRPSYGTAREGSVSATGVHYSKAQRGELSSRFFGTGMKGEEAARVSYAKDERIKNRLYFYINTGRGVVPESDVGAYAHTVDLNNLYDLDSDPLELYPRNDPTKDQRDQPLPDARMNSFESKVIDAGFDGYLTRDFGTGGAVVLLGEHAVPVQYEGAGVRPATQAFAAPVTLRGWRELQDKVSKNNSLPTGSMMGADWKRMMPKLMPEVDVSHLPDDKRFYRDQLVKRPEARLSTFRPVNTESAEFKRWFGNSQLVNPDGSPMRMYHLTPENFDAFVPGGEEGKTLGKPTKSGRAMWFANTPENIINKAGHNNGAGRGNFREGSNIMPVYLQTRRPLIIDNDTREWAHAVWGANFPKLIGEKIRADIQQDYDSVIEYGEDGEIKEVVVFDPTQIKSAISNTGEFSDTNPDIRYSTRRPVTYTEPRRLVDAALPGLTQQTVTIDGEVRGFVTLKLDNGQPKILAHVEIFDDMRGKGYAEDVIADLLGKTDELWIYNIQPDSVPFWKKMGVVLDEYEDWNHGNGTVNEGAYRANAEERGQAGQEAGDERQAGEGDGAGRPEEDFDLDFTKARFTTRRDWYYSQLAESVDAIPAKLKTGNEIALWLAANAGKLQIKKDELEWSGLIDWLKTQKTTTKDDVRSWLAENGVRVEEVVLGEKATRWVVVDQGTGGDRYSEEFASEADAENRAEELGAREYAAIPAPESQPKHASGNLVLPGGTDHREIVLTVPTIEPYNESDSTHYGDTGKGKAIAWARVNTRTDADGRKVLFVEEIQSQRGQHGRKKGFGDSRVIPEYEFQYYVDDLKKENIDALMAQGLNQQTAEALVGNMTLDVLAESVGKTEELAEMEARRPGNARRVPIAPFVSTKDGKPVDSYIALTLKRLIAYAADTGHAAVAWTTGEQQADRYDLSKSIRTVEARKLANGKYSVSADTIEGDPIFTGDVTESELVDTIGKELADKIVAQPVGEYREYSGLDLKVGGGWTAQMYGDSTGNNAQGKPSMIAAAARKLGAEVSEINFEKRRSGGMSIPPIYDSKYGDAKPPKQQPGFPITDQMREQVEGKGMALFSTKRLVGNSGRQYTPEQEAAHQRIGRVAEDKNILERLMDYVQKRWRQGIFDQFAPFYGTQAYTLMRLSKGSTGAFEAFMKHGKLSLRDGAYDADTTGGVIENVFVPLGKETTDFLYWIAANRAERLIAEGKERLFTPADIQALKAYENGTTDFDYVLANGQVTRDRSLIYRDSLKKFNEFSKNVMDMAEQSGLIDGAARKLWEHEFYVPFYRVMEDENTRAMGIKKGLVRQEAFKKLKGGEEQLGDLLMNTLLNWHHLIDASSKNRAAKAAVDTAVQMGVARPATTGETKTVWYMDGGQKAEFKVDDPAVMEAITGLQYAGLKGPLWTILTVPKHWLTVGVTASPFFKVRNLIRDSVQAIATSDLSYNVLGNVIGGAKLTARDRQEYVSALAGGGLIRFGTMLEGNEAERTRQLIRKGAKDSNMLDTTSAWSKFYTKALEPAIEAYNEIGNRGEEINRMSLYNQLIKQGIDHATASLMARDLMDFSLQGSFETIRILSQIVPFFNARMQGMYKLGRATKENRTHMSVVIFTAALASLALMGMAAGDEEKWKKWKKREEWDKASNWWFEFGGVQYRIPKPFELGTVSHIVERTVEGMFDKERDAGKRTAKALMDAALNQLSMNPVPQAFKPIIDLYANYDSFTKRPIETMSMQRLDKDQRYTAQTSMPARALSSTVGGLSPVQYDHLVRAYFGWLGALSVGTADIVARTVNDEPTKPALDYWKFATGGILQEDQIASRYTSMMYDQAAELEQAHATYNRLRKEGKLDEAKEYREDNKDKLNAYRSVENIKKQVATISERIRTIERSNLHPAEKRIKIRELKERQSQIAAKLSQ